MPFDPERYHGEYNIYTGKQQEVLTRRSFLLAQRIHEGDYASVFFLDKAARMLGIGTEALYPALYENIPFQIGYLNIGAEKVELIARKLFTGDEDKAIKEAESKAAAMKNPLEFVETFGLENIDQLTRYLASFPQGKKLIVDDISVSGVSKSLALNLMEVYDPSSQYDFFPFLQSRDDVNPFWGYNEEGKRKINLPWGRFFTLRADYPGNRGAFFSHEQTGGNLPQALKYRDEYVQLLLEAAKNNYSPTQEKRNPNVVRRLLGRILDI
jgi:hypothetical protein